MMPTKKLLHCAKWGAPKGMGPRHELITCTKTLETQEASYMNKNNMINNKKITRRFFCLHTMNMSQTFAYFLYL